MSEFEGTPKQLVNAILLTAVKMRSIGAEQETLEVGADLHPTLYGDGDVTIAKVCERMLEGDIDQMSTYNVLVLANRLADEGSGFDAVFGLRWEADLPAPEWAFGAQREVEVEEPPAEAAPPPAKRKPKRREKVPAGEIFAETIGNDGTHRRLGQDWEQRPTLEAKPERGETIVCGFRMEWLTGETDDGVPFSIESGAGVGSPWLTISYGHDGARVNERIDMRDLATQWLRSIEADLPVKEEAHG